MRTSQVLIHEPRDGRLTALLEDWALIAGVSQRHPRDLAECLELLRLGHPAVLVLQLADNIEEELAILARVSQLHPDVGIVVVGEAVHAPLVGLAWDLGADQVLILPQSRELLIQTVVGLLRPVS